MCAAADPFYGYEDHKEEQENEVTALESIYGSDLSVVSRPDSSPSSLYHLQIEISPQLPSSGLSLDIVLKDKDDAPTMPPASVEDRSTTGRIHVQHLPPLIMDITFPSDYPSNGTPGIKLSSWWLQQHHLMRISENMERKMLANNYAGEHVMFEFVEWLKEEGLAILGMEETLALTFYRPEGADTRANMAEAAASTPTPSSVVTELNSEEDLRKFLSTLKQYDDKENLSVFKRCLQECGMCLGEVRGDKCVVISGCNHVWCQLCMKAYCRELLSSGKANLSNVRCPEPGCDEMVSVTLLREVLTAQELERWEYLSLQKALDVMDDVVYCPRCNTACIRDKDPSLRLASCLHCKPRFHFCTSCREAWHQGSGCVDKAKQITEKIERLSVAQKQLVSEAERIRREEELRKLQQEQDSEKAISETTKRCPTCNVPIAKIAGCNKVVCSQCRKFMCWLCGEAIEGYEHFRRTCILFTIPDEEVDGNVINFVDMYGDQMQRIDNARRTELDGAITEAREHIANGQGMDTALRTHHRQRKLNQRALIAQYQLQTATEVLVCPECHVNNPRVEQFNDIYCWSCTKLLCFLCHKAVPGNHFVPPRPCKRKGNTQRVPPPLKSETRKTLLKQQDQNKKGQGSLTGDGGQGEDWEEWDDDDDDDERQGDWIERQEEIIDKYTMRTVSNK